MKSLNENTDEGCPFMHNFFTKEAVAHILKEGLEWRKGFKK